MPAVGDQVWLVDMSSVSSPSTRATLTAVSNAGVQFTLHQSYGASTATPLPQAFSFPQPASLVVCFTVAERDEALARRKWVAMCRKLWLMLEKPAGVTERDVDHALVNLKVTLT